MGNTGANERSGARRRLLVALAAFAFLAPGCKTWHSFKERAVNLRGSLFDSAYEDPRAEEKFANATQLFADGKYDNAREIFREVADNQTNSTDLTERARFMQAECRFSRMQFPEAVDTYHKLLMDFPTKRIAVVVRGCAGRRLLAERLPTELDRRDEGNSPLAGWPNDGPHARRSIRVRSRRDHLDTGNDRLDADRHLLVRLRQLRSQQPGGRPLTARWLRCTRKARCGRHAYAIQAKNNATGGADYDGRKCRPLSWFI